jgi:phage terminase small subunit
MPGEKAITPKQEKFAILYLETGNASEAYRQSYACGNMKQETIHRNAKALLDNTKVATRIEELKEELDISPNRVKKLYAKAWRTAETKDDAATMRGIAQDLAKIASMMDKDTGESVGAQIGALLTELERERKAKEPNVVPLRVVGNETGS